MNYRPHPHVDRALHQVERSRVRPYHYIRRLPNGIIAETHIFPDTAAVSRAFAEFARAWLNFPRRAGKTWIASNIADQAVKAGGHVHVVGRGGVRCAGGDDACTETMTKPAKCGFVHDQWLDGIYRERRRCTAPAGHSDGQFAYDHGPWESVPEPIVLARVVQTCSAVPSQWNAWTTEGQYLYLRYRSGIGTADAYDDADSEKWTRIPDGAVARFDTGDRLDGEMDLTDFCERAGLRLADDAEVIGE